MIIIIYHILFIIPMFNISTRQAIMHVPFKIRMCCLKIYYYFLLYLFCMIRLGNFEHRYVAGTCKTCASKNYLRSVALPPKFPKYFSSFTTLTAIDKTLEHPSTVISVVKVFIGIYGVSLRLVMTQ